MRLYKIEDLMLEFTLHKNGLFFKRDVCKTSRAVMNYEYLIAGDEAEARRKVKSNIRHYIHYGLTIANVGGKHRDVRDSDSVDFSAAVVRNLELIDVTNLPPGITSLRQLMDAKDFLAYCKEHLSSVQILTKLTQ